MVVNEISQVLEKRKKELTEMLENNKKDMGLEKQHQAYGALNEIDLFLETLKYYQQNSDEKDVPIRLVKPPEDDDHKGLFTRIFEDIKNKVKRNK